MCTSPIGGPAASTIWWPSPSNSGDQEAVGAVRAADWPADADALAMLRQDIEAGRSDDELVTRLADSFVTTGGGLAFDVSSLLPEAAETLLDRAAAGLADHLAAAAEPFLNAAQWAALANRELAAGSERGRPEWPFALRGCGRDGRRPSHREAPRRGDLDAAVTVARRARSLGLAALTSPAGATARQSVSDTVLDGRPPRRDRRRARRGETTPSRRPSTPWPWPGSSASTPTSTGPRNSSTTRLRSPSGPTSTPG